MPLVSPIIENAVEHIPNGEYMRATSPELNKDVGDIELKDKILVVYNNLPTVKNKVTASVVRTYPVEVKFLMLADTDDNTDDGDIIRAELLPWADMVYDFVCKDESISLSQPPTDYEIDFLNQVNMYDEILTGLVLKFNVYFDRKFFCIPPIPEPAKKAK